MRIPPWSLISFLSTFIVIYGQETNAQDACGLQETCRDCIRTLNCTWCNKVDVRELKPPQRCINEKFAELEWCSQEEKVNQPAYNVKFIQDRLLSPGKGKTRVQLQPQEVHVQIRRGEEHSFTLRYKQAEAYPVDLYIVADLSWTMRLFWNNLSKLADQIVTAMEKLTPNFQLGFGSFVDKNIRPMAADKLKWDGLRHYAFRNHLRLTNDQDSFRQEVAKFRETGNDDDPEGGLDAIMQAIVCKEEIGWRPDARHLLVYVSDDVPHIAGDGRFAGLPSPNDEKCHLNTSGYYSYAELQDYPSIGQIKWQAEENEINIIFVVGKTCIQMYEAIHRMIPGSAVGPFDKTSNHTAKLIRDHYKYLVRSLTMTTKVTSEFLDVKIFSKCLKETGQLEETNKCDGVRVNDTIEFEVVIKALDCPKNKEDWHQVIQIKPEGTHEVVTINVDLICDCNCTLSTDERKNAARTEQCNNHGVLECSVCLCDKGYFGDSCQCAGDDGSVQTKEITDACRMDNSSEICSNHGSCKCGKCACHDQQIHGKFCQCDDSICPYWKDQVCGEHGRCECGKCICASGWSGPACECSDDTSLCRPPGNDAKICSGAGTCECGQCKCNKEKGRNGRYCEDCPSCSSQRCDEFKDCVECKVHKSGKIYAEDPNCLQCSVEVTPVEEIEEDPDKIQPRAHVCRIAGDDGSTFVFTYVYGEMSDNPTIFAKEGKEFRVIDDFLAATLGVVLLTLLLGLLIILIWKITTWIHDKKEYDRFIKEQSDARWGKDNNPLYREVVATFRNPAFDTAPGNDDL